MKKVLLTLSAMAMATTWGSAQNNGSIAEPPATLQLQENKAPLVKQSQKPESVAVIWSEDFSGGIPSGWTNAGFTEDASGNLVPNANAVWEFRGPSTTPGNTVGSRGAFAAGTGVIQSATPANFVIFDSDYLDNGGTTVFGSGPAAAPHVGTLTTDTIDLTGHPAVEIAFHSYARKFVAEFEVAISTDGGLTWTDTVEVHPFLGTNNSSALNGVVTANISSAGNSANTMLRFIFDGSSGNNSNPNGDGYYFWQIDDIEVRDLPNNFLRFTEAFDADGNRVAGETRIIYDPASPVYHPSYGFVPIEQVVPIGFSANIENYGANTQNNARLEVEILSGGSTVATLSSPTFSINSGETFTLDTVQTANTWTPTAAGTYGVVFSLVSDSIGGTTGNTPVTDTTTIVVTDENTSNYAYSVDHGNVSNYFGTNSGVNAIGVAYCFPESDADSTGYVGVKSMSVLMSSLTDANGTIIVNVYDTAGMEYGSSSTGPTGQVFSKAFQLTGAEKGQLWEFDLMTPVPGNEYGVKDPLTLQSGNCYYFVMNFLASSNDSVIRIGNDATIEPDGRVDIATESVIFNSSNGGWFSGFLNSYTVNAPIMRVNMFDMATISVEEYAKQNALKVYPNPTTDGRVNVEIGLGGQYTLEVVSLTGQVIHTEELSLNGAEKLERDFSNLSNGIYMMTLKGEDFQTTRKLTIK